MKTTDLMLRDWVAYEGIPSQVIMISLEGVAMIVKEEQIIYINSEQLKPIPLTEEVFKLNGFNSLQITALPHIVIYKIKIDETNYFTLDEMNKHFYVPFCEGVADINYVHELQHYLRLIGLTDLADNFKIK